MKPVFKLIFCCFMALSLGLIFSPCHSQDLTPNPSHCITQHGNGTINWTTGTITAIGKASPQGNKEFSNESVLGSARTDANRQIIRMLKNIKVNQTLTVEDHAAKNDVILAGIEKTARDATILRQYYTSDLSVEIMVKTNILGGFLQLVLPENIRQIPIINLEFIQKSPPVKKQTPYTGMIIDARGLGIEPVLNPVIVSEQGSAIYSGEFISREFAVKNGVCNYICNMEAAIYDKRIGDYPLIFKALRKEGKENSTIVISMSDYLLLEKTTERHNFLKECRVTIVKDQ